MKQLLHSMLLSLHVSLLATAVVCIVAIPLAFFLARRSFPGKTILETLITVPLVMPPTVVGYGLIIILGRHGFIGQTFERIFGTPILFSVGGAVIAAAVVSLPLLYLPARAAFAAIEPELEDVARLMGANPLQIFWHVSLPLAFRGIGSGVLLAFARALGEFGATVMVFGIMEDRQTLPILIYQSSYDTAVADRSAAAVIVMLAVSLLIIFTYNRWSPQK